MTNDLIIIENGFFFKYIHTHYVIIVTLALYKKVPTNMKLFLLLVLEVKKKC